MLWYMLTCLCDKVLAPSLIIRCPIRTAGPRDSWREWQEVHPVCVVDHSTAIELCMCGCGCGCDYGHKYCTISTSSPHDIPFNRRWWYYVHILNNQASRDQELWQYTLYDVHTWSSVNSLIDRLPHGVIDFVITPQTLLPILKSCHNIIVPWYNRNIVQL